MIYIKSWAYDWIKVQLKYRLYSCKCKIYWCKINDLIEKKPKTFIFLFFIVSLALWAFLIFLIFLFPWSFSFFDLFTFFTTIFFYNRLVLFCLKFCSTKNNRLFWTLFLLLKLHLMRIRLDLHLHLLVSCNFIIEY